MQPPPMTRARHPHRRGAHRGARRPVRAAALWVLSLAGCGAGGVVVDADLGPRSDLGPDLTIGPRPDLSGGGPVFCQLPGSHRWRGGTVTVVPGAPAEAADLRFLRLPDGFCAHWFARVGNARQLRFAPGGELAVASPTRGTTGGGPGGLAAIVLLTDDNLDGFAEKPIPFLSSLAATQGLAFAGDHFYYQDGNRILKLPYHAGDRAPAGPATLVADIEIYSSGLHWPKPIDVADDGTIYVGNGGDQGEGCDPGHPFHGGILKLDGAPGGTPVARGFRNPIALRCARGHNRCFALELALDYSANAGGREKMVPIAAGDDWGYPCCASKDLPYQGQMPVPQCGGVQPEDAGFLIGDTPFGVDFERGLWPAPWAGRALVALHGAFATWEGARVVAIAMDPATGLPLPGNDLHGPSSGAMVDFATGWDDKSLAHGRPASVEFAADGRMFLANDVTGDIVWIAAGE